MKSRIVPIFLIVSVGVACSRSPDENAVSRFTPNAIAASSLPPGEKAEQIALGAEDLFGAAAFDESRKAFELALAQDPKNFRARFHIAFLKVLGPLRGVYRRILPMARTNREREAEFSRWFARSRETFAKPARLWPYLTEGPEDLTDEPKFQAYLDEVGDGLRQLDEFLRSEHSNEITLKVGPLWVQDPVDRFASACEVKEVGDMDFELTCPDARVRREVTLNPADYELLSASIQGSLFYPAMLNGYDLRGFLATLDSFGGRADEHRQEFLDQVVRQPEFGRLRESQKMTEMRPLLTRVLDGAQWMMSSYSTLCPAGKAISRNRPGKLYAEGVCLSPAARPYFVSFREKALGGPTPVESAIEDERISARTDYLHFFDHPVADVRSLGMAFDACGNLAHATDATFGGIFPDGDVNKVLPLAAGSRCAK